MVFQGILGLAVAFLTGQALGVACYGGLRKVLYSRSLEREDAQRIYRGCVIAVASAVVLLAYYFPVIVFLDIHHDLRAFPGYLQAGHILDGLGPVVPVAAIWWFTVRDHEKVGVYLAWATTAVASVGVWIGGATSPLAVGVTAAITLTFAESFWGLAVASSSIAARLKKHTNDQLWKNERLTNSQSLYSQNGRFQLVMTTGRLELRSRTGRIIWAVPEQRTRPRATYAVLQRDGSFEVCFYNGTPVWPIIDNQPKGAGKVILHNNGTLIAHDADDLPLWQVDDRRDQDGA